MFKLPISWYNRRRDHVSRRLSNRDRLHFTRFLFFFAKKYILTYNRLGLPAAAASPTSCQSLCGCMQVCMQCYAARRRPLAVTQQQALQIYCSELQRRTFRKTVIKIQFLLEFPFSISRVYFALHQQLWIWVGLFFYLKCFFQCFSNSFGLSANSGSFGGSRQPRQAVVLCTKCIPDRRVESLRQFASLMADC